MKNIIFSLLATLLVMTITPPTTQVNETPKPIVKKSIVKPLEATVYAQKQEIVKVPTETPKPATQAVSGSCEDWINQAGVTDTISARQLIQLESGCRPDAVNRSSGACGIPQALPCSKLGTNDPVQQIIWMQNYVLARYGSWANALAYWHCIGYCSNNYGTTYKSATWY